MIVIYCSQKLNITDSSVLIYIKPAFCVCLNCNMFIAPSIEKLIFCIFSSARQKFFKQNIEFSTDGAINVKVIDYDKSLCNADN